MVDPITCRRAGTPAAAHRTRAILIAACMAVTVFASAGTVQSSAAPSRAHASTSSSFVQASGSRFYLQGKPWYFTGYNSFELTSIAIGNGYACSYQYPVAWLGQILDEIKHASGSAVIRTWFFQSYAAANYIQCRTVLDAARARHIKIIPVLVNQWGDCEPWANHARPYRNLAWYQTGYRQRNFGYSLSFRSYAVAMAGRFANDPAIAFWQLVNEAEAKDSIYGACQERPAAHALRAFADDVAGAMKAVDHHHLISLGTMGYGQCGTSWTDYRYIHAGKIDICEYHDYAAGAIWGSPWNGVIWNVQQCVALHKPIFVGEAGIDASVQANWTAHGWVTQTSLAQRASFFQQKMDAQFAQGIAGFLVWGKTMQASSGVAVGPGDPTEAVMAAQQQRLNRTYGQVQ